MNNTNTELHYLTIGQASHLIRTRQLSPVELTRAFLKRIDSKDHLLKSYVTLLRDAAMAEAHVAEDEISRGQYRGPLHGIPIALKDLYDTKGVRTTGQSKVLKDRVPTEDATTTLRLREAGTVLLGKLAMHEFALGGPQTSLFEQARNPWNLDYVTGGSSSGSGAAVAAGLCMGALGSDTGGSIRGPAALCGIVGLKPTYGRVSRYGVIPLSWSLDHCGPMTWTVEDSALMLQVISGHDPKDPTTSHMTIPDYSVSQETDVNGLVIGIPRHFISDPNTKAESETIAVVEKALTELEGLGARVEEVSIPGLVYASVANTVIMLSEAFTYHRKNILSQPDNFGEIVRSRFYIGGLLTATDYVQAQRARSRLKRETARALSKVDVLATPTFQRPATSFAESDPYGPTSPLLEASFLAPFNQTGLPAISLPAGFSSNGLPIGLQIAGKPFDEPMVLRVAYVYEQHARWYEKRPAV